MARSFNKTTIGEALEIFGFEFEDEISKDIIVRKFRKLVLLHHPDKGGNAKKLSKVVEAKEVLLKEYGHIKIQDKKKVKSKSVGSVFVDFLKTADLKKVNSPFTTYRKGRTRR